VEVAWKFGQNVSDGNFVTYRDALRQPHEHRFFAAYECTRAEILKLASEPIAWRLGWNVREWLFVNIDEALKEPEDHRLYAIFAGGRDDLARLGPAPLLEWGDRRDK